MHNCFLSDLHSILENTKPNTAEYDSAVTDLADTVYTSCDYEDVLARRSVCLSMKEKVKTTR